VTRGKARAGLAFQELIEQLIDVVRFGHGLPPYGVGGSWLDRDARIGIGCGLYDVVPVLCFEERAAGLDDLGAIEEVDVGGLASLRPGEDPRRHGHGADPSRYSGVFVALRSGQVAPERRL
jgi:hypothetical protein